MGFFEDIGYLSEDTDPVDKVKILILTHLRAQHGKLRHAKTHVIAGKELSINEIMENAENELQFLIASIPYLSQALETTAEVDILLKYPKVEGYIFKYQEAEGPFHDWISLKVKDEERALLDLREFHGGRFRRPAITPSERSAVQLEMDVDYVRRMFSVGNLPYYWGENLIERLLNYLIIDQPDPGGIIRNDLNIAETWLRLAQTYFSRNDIENAVDAFEDAMWEVLGENSEEVKNIVENMLKRQDDSNYIIALYKKVFRYRELCKFAPDIGEDRPSFDAHSFVLATEEVYDLLRNMPSVRKKTRWLLWEILLKETGDDIELMRQVEVILPELVLRGILEQDIPGYIKSTLMQYAQYQSGLGMEEITGFLQNLYDVVVNSNLRTKKAVRVEIAWAYYQLGELSEAEKIVEGISLELPNNPSQQTDLFNANLIAMAKIEVMHQNIPGLHEIFDKILEATSGTEGDQRPTWSWKVLSSWFNILACVEDEELLNKALKLLASKSIPDQLLCIWTFSVQRNGGFSKTRDAKKLEDGVFSSLVLAISDNLNEITAAHTSLYYQMCAVAITLLCPVEERYRIADMLVAQPNLLSILWFAPLESAFQTIGVSRESVNDLVANLIENQSDWGKLFIRLVGVRQLALINERTYGFALLKEIIKEAWDLDEGTEKRQIFSRAIRIIPAFAMKEQGSRIIESILERVESEDFGPQTVRFRNEVLLAVNQAMLDLGDPISLHFIGRGIEMSLNAYKESDDKSQYLEPIENAIKLVKKLDLDGSLELVEDTAEEIVGLVKKGIDDKDKTMCVQILFNCIVALHQLGGNPEPYLETAFSLVEDLRQQRAVNRLLVEIVGQTSGELRIVLAHKALEIVGKDVTTSTDANLLVTLIKNATYDTEDYRRLLIRWQGREERRIRTRVIMDFKDF
jgi:tetratricopeptide (TPR) repeat protein